MTGDPPCSFSGDHHWDGGTCLSCGARLRCGCGQFWDGDAEHFFRCPVVLRAERHHPTEAKPMSANSEDSYEIAGMKAEPYDPIVVPGDGSDEFIEYGPVTFRSLDT